jgi:hypothetical protein
MARTNSRKISRRQVTRKSPLPALLIIVYMAGICMAYVWMHMDSARLKFTLGEQQNEIVESQNRMRNLNAEVEQLTGRRFILRKVAQFNLGLREPIPGQVHHVRYFAGEETLPVQTLRDKTEPETIVSRR